MKTDKELWASIDALGPKHQDDKCSDDSPNGHGLFGCKRCDLIVGLEDNDKRKIWPRTYQGKRLEIVEGVLKSVRKHAEKLKAEGLPPNPVHHVANSFIELLDKEDRRPK